MLYTACLGLGFKRLVQIDVMLYGALVLTEFVSLIVLRRKEPQLVRPFRIRRPACLGADWHAACRLARSFAVDWSS